MAEIILELTKALAWPTVVLVVLAAFWRPLRQAASMLPSLLEASESLQIGSLSVQLRKQFARIATEDVRKVLSELEADDMYEIISTGPGAETVFHRGGNEPGEAEQRFNKFARLGLVVPMGDDDLLRKHQEAIESGDTNAEKGDAGFIATPVYDRTHEFLVNLIPELVARYRGDGGTRRT